MRVSRLCIIIGISFSLVDWLGESSSLAHASCADLWKTQINSLPPPHTRELPVTKDGLITRISEVTPNGKALSDTEWDAFFEDVVRPMISFSNKQFERRKWGDFLETRLEAARQSMKSTKHIQIFYKGSLAGTLRIVRAIQSKKVSLYGVDGPLTHQYFAPWTIQDKLPVNRYLGIQFQGSLIETAPGIFERLDIEFASFAIDRTLPVHIRDSIRMELVFQLVNELFGEPDFYRHFWAKHVYAYGDAKSLRLYQGLGFQKMRDFPNPIIDSHGIQWWPMEARLWDLYRFAIEEKARHHSQSFIERPEIIAGRNFIHENGAPSFGRLKEILLDPPNPEMAFYAAEALAKLVLWHKHSVSTISQIQQRSEKVDALNETMELTSLIFTDMAVLLPIMQKHPNPVVRESLALLYSLIPDQTVGSNYKEGLFELVFDSDPSVAQRALRGVTRSETVSDLYLSVIPHLSPAHVEQSISNILSHILTQHRIGPLYRIELEILAKQIEAHAPYDQIRLSLNALKARKDFKPRIFFLYFALTRSIAKSDPTR